MNHHRLLALALLIGSATTAACVKRQDCEPGTIYVEVPCFDDVAAETVDEVAISVHMGDGRTVQLDSLTQGDLQGAGAICKGAVVLRPATYTPDDTIDVIFTAKTAGKAVSTPKTYRGITLAPGCTAISRAKYMGSGDGVADGGASDARGPAKDAPAKPTGNPDGGGLATPDAGVNLADGISCASDTQCAHGHCVDGVCCNTECKGTCVSCNVSGSQGTCTNVGAGAPPRTATECPKEPESSCGLDGTCDGQGACRKWPDMTVCTPGTCNGEAVVGLKQCQGGKCVEGTKIVCFPYGCNATTNACFTECTDAAQCATGRACDKKSCGQKLNGAKCTDKTECESGFCADGVCCNEACDGACQQCNNLEGRCTAVPANAKGPTRTCADQGQASCGSSGVCDGAGSCANYGVGTTCAAASCTADGLSVIPAATCTGPGTCSQPAPVSCKSWRCRDGKCLDKCTSDTDCSLGNSCDANHSCGKKGAGQNCGGDGECDTGLVCSSEGVCCNTKCDGACTSCKLSNAMGTCSPVPADTKDPRNKCADQGGCGTNGKCGAGGTCAYYPKGKECEAQRCDSATETQINAKTCDGMGMCVTGGTKQCFPGRCSGALACATGCTDSKECQSPNLCNNGNCGQRPNGGDCSSDANCTSGHCVEGVCCNTQCNSTCVSCLASKTGGSSGTCANITAGTVAPTGQCAANGTCGNNGKCNGSGACAVASSGTNCGAASCVTGNYFQPSASCDGAGFCKTPNSSSCGNYACTSSGCANPCANDSNCVNGYYCANGICTAKKANGLGCSAAASNQCASGICSSDAFCCDRQCSDACESCSTGACTNVCINHNNLNVVSSLSGYCRASDNFFTRTDTGAIEIGFETGGLLRGFLTFDISSLEAGKKVVSATMTFPAPYIQYESDGYDPFGDLGPLYIESVAYGATLEYQDFNLNALSTTRAVVGKAKASSYSVDVTSFVADDYVQKASRSNRSQFRLRWSTETGGHYLEYISFDKTGITLSIKVR